MVVELNDCIRLKLAITLSLPRERKRHITHVTRILPKEKRQSHCIRLLRSIPKQVVSAASHPQTMSSGRTAFQREIGEKKYYMNKVNDSENKDDKLIRFVNFFNIISSINPISYQTQYQPVSYHINPISYHTQYNPISYHTLYQPYFMSYPLSTLFHIIPNINPI